MFRLYYEMKAARVKENAAAIKAEIKDVDTQVAKLVDRIVSITNESALGAIENKMKHLSPTASSHCRRPARLDSHLHREEMSGVVDGTLRKSRPVHQRSQTRANTKNTTPN